MYQKKAERGSRVTQQNDESRGQAKLFYQNCYVLGWLQLDVLKKSTLQYLKNTKITTLLI